MNARNPNRTFSPRWEGQVLVNKPQKKKYMDSEWSHLETDERGAELAREARFWKVYVGETDKWDKELVEGWDKSMDVLLVFAALFSAISAAFLIETSKMLKEDPSDVSAAALRAISEVLVIVATNNSMIAPPTLPPTEGSFIPPKNAIIVNTLWFMSLSLSIGTAFLAMLAKDWTYSFLSHRTGHPRDQAHRRQRKWKLIERWKMQELILLLPSLVHLSLCEFIQIKRFFPLAHSNAYKVLFAIGLCVYLWDLNRNIAIPVMCIAGVILVFYIWSSITASLVEFFPYTTIISRILSSSYMHIFYPALTGIACFFALLPVFASMGICIVFLGLAYLISRITLILSGLFLVVDRIFLKQMARTWADVYKLAFSNANAVLDWVSRGLAALAMLAFRVCSRVCSCASDAIKSLALSEDLITSLALGWLIQYCETPSAVDIALQAIAGANEGIPKEPLLSSQATEQIMRRIVSRSTNDDENSTSDLYARGLQFLGLNSGSGLAYRGPKSVADIAVMVWDLKSKNQRKIEELIKARRFIPTDDNLEAMRIGNSAPSQFLHLLNGEAKGAIDILDSITKLLSRNFESGYQQLHPAAVQSLANAAALYLLLPTASVVPPRLVDLCMNYSIRSIINRNLSLTRSEPTKKLSSEVIFIICILLHRYPSRHNLPETGYLITQNYNYVWHTIRTLIDIFTEGETLQTEFFWVASSEILYHISEYGLDKRTSNCQSLKYWNSQHAGYLAQQCTPYISSGSQVGGQVSTVRNRFIMAVYRVYALVAALSPHDSMPKHLPNSTQAILTAIACSNALDSSDSQTCNELLSSFDFPRLSKMLITSLQMPTLSNGVTLLKLIGIAYSGIAHPRVCRYFAATQIWLLLHLAGDSSSENQRRLIESIELELESILQLQSKGIDQVKKELEKLIIEGYRETHGISNKVTVIKSHGQSIWDKIKSHCLMRVNTQNYPLIGGGGLSLIKDALQMNIEDPFSPENPWRVYTARIVKLILETRGFRGNEDLATLIRDDFKQLSPCFQRIPPALVPLPPSCTTSPVLWSIALEEMEIDDSDHMSVEVYFPGATPNSGDHDSDPNSIFIFNDSSELL